MQKGFFSTYFPPPKYLRLPAAGLDISDRAIKYVELVVHRGELHLGKYGEADIPEGVIVQGVVKDQDKLVNILGGIRQRTNLSIFHVSLPEEKAYLVEMEVPYNAGYLHGTIELHLEEHFPIETKLALFDYEIIHTPENSGKNVYVIAVSALEGQFASDYFKALRLAGYLPLSFEFESQAISRAVVPASDNGVVMIADIGREQSNIAIVANHIVRLTGSLSVGGNALSEAIKKDLKVSIEEAVRLKEKEGLLHRELDKSAFSSIIRVATVLRDEISQRLIYWNSGRPRSNSKDTVSSIILCGGNANIPGLPEYLTSGIEIPVSIANPWGNFLSFDKIIPEITAGESLKYCTAIGLALRSTQLL